MEFYVVSDALIFGKGVFGVFSTLEKAIGLRTNLRKKLNSSAR